MLCFATKQHFDVPIVLHL